MSSRELQRLCDLLGELSGTELVDGQDRDAIATIRTKIHDELDRREASVKLLHSRGT